ncbi:M1 family metallopeptidase [Loigolactobacillus backii]|uniref:Aminopeptidase n=1 Tax=Loigolactobacillus backii TaxID=375175 RepID=A0A192H263_9LACO|nr:M1 family metallopeptidase [Loigolactobacillus backii]ANK62368.1 peptidase [Loigolactobacillus backii]ANK70620.1 peptidase [Loigolactobacillus backii]MDA5387865.1 M1 family metallopeptidase [Loigolactobacillus backii]MDA5390351.1 M1 family metallopeptidase [Loigolactobacillus backii]PIO82841.1 peptidase [Loigolactobacillus backii]
MTELTRFYNTFQPSHYNIFLDINRESKQYTGKTTITGDAKTQTIAVHQKDLTIESVQVDGQNRPFTIDAKADAVRIELANTGDVTLTITYKAALTDSMMGIYPSYYELNGVKKQIIGTQFETNFARQAFPCIDEPEAKATFALAIKFDEHPGETIISNMPEVRNENGIHYFDTTVRMSTYLIAFAFGELQSKQTTTKSGVQVGVFATKAHQANELDFALDIAKRSIEFYEDFYQTPYPLPHSWQLALPDFSAGAMENWGLVTYREAYLLLDPENTALDMKQLIATVIAHELAHQWFGDLVTMKWWDDLWLNESFANMMEYVAIDALEPDWHIWEMFQTSEASAALQRDAIDGVQSVHVQVENPAEIDALFDSAIVYAKGARMLVMVRALIGDDALRAGLKDYLGTHKYNNATGADLWSALGAASKMDLGTIMKSWLEQPGYPVVTAAVVAGKLTLTQQQFFSGKGQEVGRKWQIPLNSNYAAAPAIMAEKTLAVGDYAQLRAANGKPFRLNLGNNSHFIVKYDRTLLADILNNLTPLDAISQLQVLQDLRLLAEGRQIAYADIVPLLARFADSHSNVVNAALYQVASNLKKFVTPNSAEEKDLQAFFNQLSSAQVARLGWTPKASEVNDDQLTRPVVLNAALYAQNKNAVKTAHDLFTANKDHLATLPAATRVFILKNEVKNFGSAELFNQLLAAYRQTADGSYKSDLCAALTSTPDATLIAQLIEKFEDADTIKPQDLRAWFRGVLATNEGEQAAWDWIRRDWQWLEETVGGDMEFTTYITVIASIFRTPERLAEFKAFFEPKLNTPGLTREITMDTKMIESRVDLIEAEKDAVNAAITKIIR